MTQIVTMSAYTAAYAAEVIKPSARMRGDGPTDEAITLLSTRPAQEAATIHRSVAALQNPTALSLMLMNSKGRMPQESRAEALRRYRENEWDEPEQEEPSADEEHQPHSEDEVL